MPTIRTHLIEAWYASLEDSCNRHEFEAVLCGPFKPPASVLAKDNVTWIKSFASPTVCAQMALTKCSGDYVFHTVDDSLFFPNVISNELDEIEHDEIIAMRYREGQDHTGSVLPSYYWYARNAYPRWGGVHPDWGICVHFMMDKGICIQYGGFDCKYDYLNHATHDLLFRIHNNENIEYRLSKQEISSASWQPNTTGDHSPIHNAQIFHDEPLFQKDWLQSNTRAEITLDNFESQTLLWTTRFSGKENGYQDLPQG
jgi:hypothetical protein